MRRGTFGELVRSVPRLAVCTALLSMLFAACGTARDVTADASHASDAPSSVTTTASSNPAQSRAAPTTTTTGGTSTTSEAARGAVPPSTAGTGTSSSPGGAPTSPPRTPQGTPSVAATSAPGGQTVGIDCVAAVLKRHPIDLAPYNAATGRAGDASFVRPVLFNRVFTEFGFVIPAASTSTGNDKPNPQPTYLAPMGTKVRSAVDGVVDRISNLWSTPTLGDVSVMVKPDGLAGRCYMVVEFEHVVNPVVRVGDRVSVGQPIAEVGPLNSQGSQGLGLVEFGILTGSANGRPLHVCPYAYFDPAVRGQQLATLSRYLSDWEAYAGDRSLYDEAAWIGGITGCRSAPIEE